MDQIDILSCIFSFLNGKDLIECSKVNRKFYCASSPNRLWFEMLNKESEKFLKNKIKYNHKINFKLMFLSLFNQSYKSQFISFYRESFLNFVWNHPGEWYEKLILSTMFVIPASILTAPFGLAIEISTLYQHKNKKYEYCKCDNCFQNIKDKLKLLNQ
jgi:hypothetical protein